MNNDKRPLYIPYAGPALLETPLLNKGSAFSVEERMFFNLEGLLPEAIETIEEQTERAYKQFLKFENDMDKHIYLRNIQDTNETLFYRLVENHITEMMPIIYTPTVGAACEDFSNISGFKEILLQKEKLITRNLINKLLLSGTGREMGVADRPAIDTIVEQLDATNGGMRDLLKAVIQSEIFLTK